jgi:DNA-binding response OmpR family regulator
MRILIAEDDRQLRASIARGLREASYSVDQAGSGAQAISLAAANAYDALVLDVVLPDTDGLAVCRTLRDSGNRVPILMLTALDGVEQRIAGLDAGADDYLTKPFEFGELLARLRAVGRRRLDGVGQSITVGDLVIDTARHAASRGQRTIVLTAKEYSLLVYLARNAGRVVSRTELLQHVWDDPKSSYSNVIDVYAARLRRKIDAGETTSLFTTVRGAGFLLEAPTAAAPETAPAQPARRKSARSRR